MKIENSRILLAMGINVFDEAIKALQVNNHIPKKLEIEKEFPISPTFTIPLVLHVFIDPPEFVLEGGETPVTRLKLTGQYNVCLLDSKGNPPLDENGNIEYMLGETHPNFHATFNLGLALKRDKQEDAPYVGLQFAGLHKFDFASRLLLELSEYKPMLDESMKNLEKALADLSENLDTLKLDIVKPLIKVVESIYFLDEDKELELPSFGAYPVFLELVPNISPDTKPMVALVINYPLDEGKPDFKDSLLPASAELMLYVDPEVLVVLVPKLEKRAKELTKPIVASLNDEDSYFTLWDLKLNDFSLSLDKSSFLINADIENDHWFTGTILRGNEVKVKGEIPLRHSPGAPMIFVDTHKIEIDLDTPWMVPSSEERKQEREIADNLKVVLKMALNAALSELGKSLDIAQGIVERGFPVKFYPDTFTIHDNGAMSFLIQIYILPKSEGIEHASYSKMFRRFVLCKSTTGRRFQITDLAEMMADGWISMEGYQQVGRKYIRTIPDGNPKNNMKAMFWK